MSPDILKYLSLCIYFKEILYLTLSSTSFLPLSSFWIQKLCLLHRFLSVLKALSIIIILVFGEIPWLPMTEFYFGNLFLGFRRNYIQLRLEPATVKGIVPFYHFSFSYRNPFRTYVIHPCILELPGTKELFDKCWLNIWLNIHNLASQHYSLIHFGKLEQCWP